MKEFTAEKKQSESMTGLYSVMQWREPKSYAVYIGLDVHKETIMVALARNGRGPGELWGEIANTPKAVAKLVVRLSREFGGEVLSFCYEAGPCGYGLYRQLLELGHECQVVAPSLIPRKPGERIKTDRRDALKLAHALRSGDLRRFESPRQLMAYLGLVPSEHTSGSRRRQGAITLTGNGPARRMLVESAWSYRFPARQTMHLKRKAKNASDEAKVIAWRAQKRLCGRYRTLTQAGKNTKLVCVAVARELVGFVWDITCREMAKVDRSVTR